MKYDLTVSIVVYKPKLQQLRQTLESLRTTKLHLQIILLDNSPTPLDLRLLPDSLPLTYIFRGENGGYGRAHNEAIQKYTQSAPYFLVLNPDVYFGPNLLESLLKNMNEDPTIGLCIPKICHPQGHMQIINRRLPRPIDYVISFVSGKLQTNIFKTKKYDDYQLEDIDTKKSFICPTISGCFMFFRSSTLQQVGGFDERFFLYLEDTDLSRRVSHVSKVVVFSNLKAYHYWSRGAYRNPKLFLTFVKSLIRYFNKWGWFWDMQRESLNAQVAYYQAPTLPAHHSAPTHFSDTHTSPVSAQAST